MGYDVHAGNPLDSLKGMRAKDMKTALQKSLAVLVVLAATNQAVAGVVNSSGVLEKLSAIGGQVNPGSPAPAAAAAPIVAEPIPAAAAVPEAPKGPVRARSGRFTVAPDFRLTPGVLCTTRDRDFKEFRYEERIPYCQRNFSQAEKKEVSRWYGVDWEDHHLYQYDHLLSLCLGGSNALTNVWPMLWDEARKKAGMEADLCRRLARGELTQAQAVREELSWFAENAPEALRALSRQ